MNYSQKKTVKKMISGLAKGACLIGLAGVLCANLSGMASREAEGKVQEAEVQTLDKPLQPAASVPPVATPVPTVDPTIACGSFINPAVGVISSNFGERWGRQHTGVDIAGETGSAILAADAGVIIYADWMSGYGNYIIIDHENGTKTAYGHCDTLLVSSGERVTQGQVIAQMGSTGNSTGPHLHFEIKVDDEYQDPLGYVAY